MRVLIFEENLMWSSRLALSIQRLGYQSTVIDHMDVEGEGDVAIINLGSAKLAPSILVPRLKARDIPTIAHAGHKEKELHALGRDLGCDALVTNSELTYKLPEILERVTLTRNA